MKKKTNISKKKIAFKQQKNNANIPLDPLERIQCFLRLLL